MDQRGVLLDDERREEPDSPPLKGVWAALAGVAVVVVIAVVTSSAANELDPPGSTLPDIPMVTVPPSMAEGEVVSRTLEWTKAVGPGTTAVPIRQRFGDRHRWYGQGHEDHVV